MNRKWWTAAGAMALTAAILAAMPRIVSPPAVAVRAAATARGVDLQLSVSAGIASGVLNLSIG